MSKIDELIISLNKEYGGNIKIGDIEEKSIPVSSVHYVASILEAVEPLYIDIPIVVAKEGYFDRSYKIIDGYHRFKAKMNQQNIDVIVISDYSISRDKGDIVELLEKSVGKSMIFLSNDAMQVGQDVYEIKTNEGCGGCSNGWSSIDVDSDFVGKRLKIKTVEEQASDNKYDDDQKKLIVNAKHIATLDYGWGNGYYGGGFELYKIATMTPTEQDKELRALLDEFVLYTDSTPESNEPTELKVFLERCDFPDAIGRLYDELMQLITADRKRVALEARLDEVKRTPTDLSVFNYDFDKRQGITQEERIAQLKAEQEKR